MWSVLSKITFPHSFGNAAWIAVGALSMALGFAAPVALKTCEVDHGNIVLEDNGKRTTLTNSGLDSDPVGFGEAPSQPDAAKPVRPRRIAGIGEKKLEHVDPQLLGEHRLRTVDPVDPRPPAERGRQDQVLVFVVVIDEEGRLKDAQFVSGNPLLLEAARAALAQWRFKPFLFDGRPAAVAAQISVRFPAK
jgi:hypothetical protein